jgi:hypothetical protein
MVKITNENTCTICNKKIGASVFVMYPNGVLVHFVCHKNQKAVRTFNGPAISIYWHVYIHRTMSLSSCWCFRTGSTTLLSQAITIWGSNGLRMYIEVSDAIKGSHHCCCNNAPSGHNASKYLVGIAFYHVMGICFLSFLFSYMTWLCIAFYTYSITRGFSLQPIGFTV